MTPVAGDGAAAADAAADPSLLTPASFVHTQSDGVRTPAGSRVHSMEFPRVDEQEEAQQREGGDCKGEPETPAASRLSRPSYAAVAASAAHDSSSDAAAQDIAGTNGRAAASGSRPAAGDAAASPQQSDSGHQAEDSAASSPSQPPACDAADSAEAKPASNGTDIDSSAGHATAEAPPPSGRAAGTPSSIEPPTNAEGDLLHPWSLAQPAPLAVPKPADAAPATISLADASAPVGELSMERQRYSMRAVPVHNCNECQSIQNHAS